MGLLGAVTGRLRRNAASMLAATLLVGWLSSGWAGAAGWAEPGPKAAAHAQAAPVQVGVAVQVEAEPSQPASAVPRPSAPPASPVPLASPLVNGLEVLVGSLMHADVVKQAGGPYTPPPETKAWLDQVFADVAKASDRQDVPYTLTVVASPEVNAYALMGGYVYLTRGMLEFLNGDTDALANVLGHEVAHVARRHGWNAFVRRLGLALLLDLGVRLVQGGPEAQASARRLAGIGLELVQRGWGREAEYEADDVGQALAAAAGYDPAAMPRFFSRLRAQAGPGLSSFLQWLSTHPALDDRIARSAARASQLRPAPAAPPAPAVPNPGNASPGPLAFTEPAGRFALQLSAGWQLVEATRSGPEEAWHFAGPRGRKLAVYLLSVPNRTPEEWARSWREDLREGAQAFRVLQDVTPGMVAGEPAAFLAAAWAHPEGRKVQLSAAVRHGPLMVDLIYSYVATADVADWASFTAILQTVRLGP